MLPTSKTEVPSREAVVVGWPVEMSGISPHNGTKGLQLLRAARTRQFEVGFVSAPGCGTQPHCAPKSFPKTCARRARKMRVIEIAPLVQGTDTFFDRIVRWTCWKCSSTRPTKGLLFCSGRATQLKAGFKHHLLGQVNVTFVW